MPKPLPVSLAMTFTVKRALAGRALPTANDIGSAPLAFVLVTVTLTMPSTNATSNMPSRLRSIALSLSVDVQASKLIARLPSPSNLSPLNSTVPLAAMSSM